METLVLSNCFQPIDQIGWQRAVTLWWTDKVEILEEYQDRSVQSVTFSMKMPAVVRVLNTTGRRKGSVKFSRENVFTRDKGRCQYCCSKLKAHEATYDHVVPRRMGGLTRWDNVVICCWSCNQKKGGRTPEQAGMRLLLEPVKPKSLPVTFRLAAPHRRTMPTTWAPYLQNLAPS